MREFLKGKKSYLLAASTVIGALIGWSQGEIGNLTFIGVILAAVQSCFIRAGLATEARKSNPNVYDISKEIDEAKKVRYTLENNYKNTPV